MRLLFHLHQEHLDLLGSRQKEFFAIPLKNPSFILNHLCLKAKRSFNFADLKSTLPFFSHR